jgi:hypothetical protein
MGWIFKWEELAMLRRLTGGACGLMLGLCVLVSGLWIASYRDFVMVQLPVSAGGTRWQCVTYRGLLAISTTSQYPFSLNARAGMRATSPARARHWDGTYWGGSDRNGAILGFSAEDGEIAIAVGDGLSVQRHWSAMILPYWMLMALGALLPISTVIQVIRARRRLAHGLCETCGYVLVDGACHACAARAAVVGLTPRPHLVRPA